MPEQPLLVLFLPGLDGTGRLFEPVLRELPAQIEAQVVQFPPDRALGYEELVPYVEALLPCDRPFALVAESFSGPLALRIAARQPAGLAPRPQQPGYAPEGASGIHIATCVRPSPLAEDGTVLGHEILIADIGCSFNSPESLHIDERKRLGEAGVVPNEHGLIDSFDDALACCRVIDPAPGEGRSPGTTWLPWLIVRYAL